ncbi:YgjV family protein [Ferrimonas senticii]|uniref:YgjV family protein n=1 Tax=Ferrimonas senticii TaxID=394566 RepID=UPI000427D2E6|nr:YgjV family protein [Ferrimonas senticii]
MTAEYWQWVGYAASITIAVSLMMSDMVKLRWWNLTGAILFVAYGSAISAWPVALVNAFIVCINIYYLQQHYRTS